ncbi:MAG: M23 family metallopeptidase [Leptolyngbya sp. IPPAS B-1204]|nr:M23 family metallopeptidase [Elainella sp. C42_A2020_010]
MLAAIILLQLLLPLLLIGWIAIVPPRSLLGFWMQAIATALGLLALARTGLWVFPPWWTPYLYGLLFVAALIVGLRRYKSRRLVPSDWLAWIAIIGFAAFGIYAANEAAQSLTGRFQPEETAVELAFPLLNGNYLIVNGGSDIRLNAHLKLLNPTILRFRAYRGNSYGLDIVKIDRFGLRAQGIVPRDPDAYHIYGEPVVAPCSGKLVTVIDGLPDMSVPEVDRSNLAGNHLILRCDNLKTSNGGTGNVDVVLAHFRPNSLTVQSGAQVKVGDRLGEVGNSGVSNEPHLHIHAQQPGSATAPMSGNPLPIRFDGRFLIRNDRVSY